MNMDTENGRRFWRDPAWLSIFLTLLLQMLIAAYINGQMAAKVDMLEHQNDVILQHLLLHNGEGPRP